LQLFLKIQKVFAKIANPILESSVSSLFFAQSDSFYWLAAECRFNASGTGSSFASEN
jgi:hypothetical protein